MAVPLIAPITRPVPTPPATPSEIEPVSRISEAPTTEARLSVEPTDRSMPPSRNTKVAPIAAISSGANSRAMLLRLATEVKPSTVKQNRMNAITNTGTIGARSTGAAKLDHRPAPARAGDIGFWSFIRLARARHPPPPWRERGPRASLRLAAPALARHLVDVARAIGDAGQELGLRRYRLAVGRP